MARRAVSRRVSVKRMTNWIQTGAATQVSQSGGANAGTLWSIGLADAGLGIVTVVRIRGSVDLRHGSGVEGEQHVGVGIAMCTDKEVDAGGASLPLPLTDASDDRWMWHWSGVVGTRGITAVSPTTTNQALNSKHIVVDSKAMRKWDERQTLCFLIESLNLSGTTSIVFAAAWARILVKVS